MRRFYFLAFFTLSSFLYSQNGFYLNTKEKKITIPFKLINNLVVIPINLNGVDLNFLLDTGVEKTILFSLDEGESLEFKNVKKIKVKGLGIGEAVEAYYSKENVIKIRQYCDLNHEVYIILNQDVNFSSQLGFPVYGILGSEFFKNNLVEINYKKRKIFVYQKGSDISIKRMSHFQEVPITIESEKPYATTVVKLNDKTITAKLLLDSGGSDAIWLFQDRENIVIPTPNFDDFLGKGFSGTINGKRSRIQSFKWGSYEILNPTTSFPDEESFKSVELVKDRKGSIGAEILRRFNLIFDYANQRLYIQKNAEFLDPFNYNMSGIEFEHGGLEMVKENSTLQASLVRNEVSVIDDRPSDLKYKFVLKPIFKIANVRFNSPGGNAGALKGDVVKRINGIEAYRYSLEEINRLMQSEEGKTISLEIERKGVIIKVKFELKKLL